MLERIKSLVPTANREVRVKEETLEIQVLKHAMHVMVRGGFVERYSGSKDMVMRVTTTVGGAYEFNVFLEVSNTKLFGPQSICNVSRNRRNLDEMWSLSYSRIADGVFVRGLVLGGASKMNKDKRLPAREKMSKKEWRTFAQEFLLSEVDQKATQADFAGCQEAWVEPIQSGGLILEWLNDNNPIMRELLAHESS